MILPATRTRVQESSQAYARNKLNEQTLQPTDREPVLGIDGGPEPYFNETHTNTCASIIAENSAGPEVLKAQNKYGN